MLEILMALVIIGIAIWLAKVALTKVLKKLRQSHHHLPTGSSINNQNSAFNRHTFEAPELLKLIYKLDPKVYVFSDLETTGLSPEKHGITELAAIKYTGGDEVECFSTLVNPGISIPKAIKSITGITNEMVSKAPNMKSVLPAFKDFVGDAELIFYNASFDESFLKKASVKLNNPIQNKFFDALKLAKEAFQGLQNHKLQTVAKQLNVTSSGAHRALSDTSTLMFVYLGCRSMLIEEEKLMNVTKLGQRLGGYSAITTNKALIEQGFQTKVKNEEGKWEYTVTEKGRPHIQHSDDESYFLWNESVIGNLCMQKYKTVNNKAKDVC